MTVIEDAKRLLTLSRFNPEFISKYTYTINKLDEIIRTDVEHREEAKSITSKLYAHKAGTIYNSVQQAYIQFTTGVLQNMKDSEIFKDVSVIDLINARRIAYGFLKIANSSISRGAHNDRNDYIITYIEKLAGLFVEKVKQDDESKWDTFYELETVVIEAIRKHLIYREDIAKLTKVFQVAYVIQDKMFTENDKFVDRMNLFGVTDKENKLEEYQTMNKLKYLFIKDLTEFKSYYKDLRQRIEDMYRDKLLTDQEHIHYIGKFPAYYSSLLNDRPCKYYVPICAYQYTVVTGSNPNHLLMFTQQEMFTAYKFAYKFCKFYTNEVIEKSVIDYVELQERSIEAKLGKKDSTERVKETYISYLDVLQKNNIITPMDYCKYIEKYRLG